MQIYILKLKGCEVLKCIMECIGQGLRADLEKLEGETAVSPVQSPQKQGADESMLQTAVSKSYIEDKIQT